MALSGTSSKCVQLTKFKKLGLLTSCVKEEAVLTFQLPDWWMCSARLSFGLTKIQGKKHVRELQREQAQTMPHDTGDTISCSRCTLLRESVQLFNGTIFALQKMFLLHGISSAHTHTHTTHGYILHWCLIWRLFSHLGFHPGYSMIIVGQMMFTTARTPCLGWLKTVICSQYVFPQP